MNHNERLLKYAEKLDKDGKYEEADKVTAAAIPEYGKMALDRLYSIYGPQYEPVEHMSKNYQETANSAFSHFLSDIHSLEPELMKWFNQDYGYNDEPDYEELKKTHHGRELLAQYVEFGWEPDMKSSERGNNFQVYRLILRLLERAGAEVPNVYLSEDRDFKVEQLLKDPKTMRCFINEMAELPHETILQLMPPKYMTIASNATLDEYLAGKKSKQRRKKKIIL